MNDSAPREIKREAARRFSNRLFLKTRGIEYFLWAHQHGSGSPTIDS
jgi:hypothetical protein